MSFEVISVVGLGYIGLPTAAVFASRKKKVVGVDVNRAAVELINKGQIHIVEPDLDKLVHTAVTEGYLRATTTPEAADVFLIAVPTPFKDDHQPDLSYIESASRAIAPVLKSGNLVILESTSPVGATEQMSAWLAECRPDLSFPQHAGEASDIRIAHCPERVLPGHVLRELVQNDRIIGGMTNKCSALAVDVYKIFVEAECIITDSRTAEMCKLTENSFRDVNIAFANELSMICSKLSINVWELIQLANRHPRVNILQPGPGVGGHCIAVDPWFIVSRTPEQAKLISAARNVNDSKPEWVIQQVVNEVEIVRRDKVLNRDVVVSCLGLTFKPNIDDLRESPALKITKQLALLNDVKVNAVEPNIKSDMDLDNIHLTYLDSAINESDIVLILVAHSEFLDIKVPSTVSVIDTVGVYNNQASSSF